MPSIMGNEDFKGKALTRVQNIDSEVNKKGIQSPVSLQSIVNKVATYYKLPVESICKAKRGQGTKNIPRWVAMKLCQEIGSAKLTEIAEVFNVGYYSTVSQSIGRLRRLMSENDKVRDDFNILSQDLTP